ncbi:MAG: hypothetical protein RBQ71_07380 [Acholeplasmataceae bacterium]|jgi:hypothetical protein|nr:hypothetical protein [Acholeplasmataceae bacterium]
MHGHFTGRTTGDSSIQLINADKNHVKDRLAQSDTTWKVGVGKGMDTVTIVTLSIFAAIIIFVVVMILIR